MSLADEYARQFPWRPWPALFAELPPLAGRTVLDLGCAIGDQAAELAARGARVIGMDGNAELLAHARSRGLPNVEIRSGDLRQPVDPGEPVDGLWASFVAAYCTDIESALRGWLPRLRPGGWVALTEVDDLFAHAPLSARARALLFDYADQAFRAGRYDFRMGRRLPGVLRACGLTVVSELVVPDRELSFNGPAPPEIVAAWRARLERLPLLHTLCGGEYPALRDEFLACLGREDHRSEAQVRFCLATRLAATPPHPSS